MKKAIVMLVILVMCFCLVACGGSANKNEKSAPSKDAAGEPAYKIKSQKEDGVTFYNVSISNKPDWSKDDWWDHTEYATKILAEVQKKHDDDSDIWIIGYVNGNESDLVFSWNDTQGDPETLLLYKYDESSDSQVPTEDWKLTCEDGIWQ